MRIKNTFPLLLLALIGVTAYADSITDGFYVTGQVTHSSSTLDQSKFTTALTTAGATGIASSANGSGTEWRLQLGYQLNPNFAIEAGYIDFGKTNYTANYTGGSASGTQKPGGVDVVAVGILPLTPEFSVFGKLGGVAVSTKTSLSASTLAAATTNTSSNGVRPLIGLGASYNLQKNLDLRADIDHVSGLGKTSSGGAVNENTVSLGVSYHF